MRAKVYLQGLLTSHIFFTWFQNCAIIKIAQEHCYYLIKIFVLAHSTNLIVFTIWLSNFYGNRHVMKSRMKKMIERSWKCDVRITIQIPTALTSELMTRPKQDVHHPPHNHQLAVLQGLKLKYDIKVTRLCTSSFLLSHCPTAVNFN